MKTFFSLVTVNTNSFSNESIVVGMLAIAKKIHFAYSTKKLSWVHKIENGHLLATLCENNLKKLDFLVSNENKKISQLKLVDELFSHNYFTYLSKYSAGAFKLSKPFEIVGDFDEKDFAIYFNKFVGDTIEKKIVVKSEFSQKIHKTLTIQGLKEKADINFEFKPQSFDSILKEAKVSLITKNGSIQAFQAIDFSKSESSIVNKLYETQMIYESLKHFAKEKKEKLNKINIAFDKPEQNSAINKLFEKAVKEKKDCFSFIESDEFHSISSKISTSPNYIKFSNLVSI
jgi:hypothetical protein